MFSDGFRPPRLIKIDTEGDESAVFSGLAKTIATYRPVFFFEHISTALGKIKDIVSSHYQLYAI